ncbi:hypothetical protein FKM82_014147 [Ascaphus truei]
MNPRHKQRSGCLCTGEGVPLTLLLQVLKVSKTREAHNPQTANTYRDQPKETTTRNDCFRRAYVWISYGPNELLNHTELRDYTTSYQNQSFLTF